MRAFYIIRPNLELRFGIDDGVVRKEDIVVLLESIGLLRILTDEDLSIENASTLVSQYSLVKLVGFRMRNGVVHIGVVVHMCFSME